MEGGNPLECSYVGFFLTHVMRTEREMHLILWPWSCLVWHDSGMRWFFFLFGSLECVYSNHSKPFCWRRKTINFSVQCIFWNLLTVWWTTFFRARTGVSYFNTHRSWKNKILVSDYSNHFSNYNIFSALGKHFNSDRPDAWILPAGMMSKFDFKCKGGRT